MNRRHFLRTTVFAGAFAGAGLLARPGHALSEVDCGAGDGGDACGELVRHRRLVAQLAVALQDPSLSEEARAMLLAATCPVCGAALLPPAVP